MARVPELALGSAGQLLLGEQFRRQWKAAPDLPWFVAKFSPISRASSPDPAAVQLVKVKLPLLHPGS